MVQIIVGTVGNVKTENVRETDGTYHALNMYFFFFNPVLLLLSIKTCGNPVFIRNCVALSLPGTE